MKTLLIKELRASLLATLILAVLCCGLYPLAVWALGQAAFPAQAKGSLLVKDGTVWGSALIAQEFKGEKYFHPRPSAAGNGWSSSSRSEPAGRSFMRAIRRRRARPE